MKKQPTTAWMWPSDHGGVNGINLDVTDHKIYWFDDAAACACGDSTAVQTFVQFKAKGSPLGKLPADVRGELLEAIALLENH